VENFEHKIVLIFFTALGVMLGSAMVGSLAAVIVREPPVAVMLKLARDMKIWAIAAAIGGTFYTFEIFDSGLFSALAGTQFGYYLILSLCEGRFK